MIAQANHVRIEHLVFDGAPLPRDGISEPAHPAGPRPHFKQKERRTLRTLNCRSAASPVSTRR